MDPSVRSKRLDVAGRMATELRRLHDAAARGFVQPGYCQDSAALRTGLNNVLLKSSKLRQGQFDLGDQLSCRTMLCVVRHLVAAEHQSDILAVLLDHVASGLGEMPTWASTETRTSFDVNVTRGQGITSAALAELSRHPIAGQALGSVVVIALWPVSGASRPVYWHEMLITQAHGQSLWADVAIAHEALARRPLSYRHGLHDSTVLDILHEMLHTLDKSNLGAFWHDNIATSRTVRVEVRVGLPLTDAEIAGKA